MTTLDVVALISAFVVLLAIGGTVTEWTVNASRRDARRRNHAHRRTYR